MADRIENHQPPRYSPLYKPDGSIPEQLGFKSKWRGYHIDTTYTIPATTTSRIDLDVADINGVVGAVNLGNLCGKKPFLFIPKYWSINLVGDAFPIANKAVFHGMSWYLLFTVGAVNHPLVGDSPYVAVNVPIGRLCFKQNLPTLLYNTFDDFDSATDYMQNVLLDATMIVENPDAAAHNLVVHQYLLYDVVDVPADYMMAQPPQQ